MTDFCKSIPKSNFSPFIFYFDEKGFHPNFQPQGEVIPNLILGTFINQNA